MRKHESEIKEIAEQVAKVFPIITVDVFVQNITDINDARAELERAENFKRKKAGVEVAAV